ncbi:2-oxoglutarate dehydrogenase E1 component [Planctomycetes bacterium Pan216]|uniref:2-oxoglutarate dehydrogenase E1 component n=1 Tax=Kolteria novifilia TaxID=2527975 RepID=A0A518B7P5_9BACT|nr:2-oxoglutarate dehydrogenase E1 component [Planctomycetes bacterium Pan216]
MSQQDHGPLGNSLSLAFVESLYADYVRDPSSVSSDWQTYFRQLTASAGRNGYAQLGPSFRPSGLFNPPSAGGQNRTHAPAVGLSDAVLQHRTDQLIRNFRVRGHIIAAINPLGFRRTEPPPEILPEFYGLRDADLDRQVSTERIEGIGEEITLRKLLDLLRDTYCRNIGVQFMHIDDLAVREWLQERMEGTQNRLALTREEQFRILTRLTDAVIFEEFIQKKFVGAKSFSLEGAESLIPLLDLAIERAGQQGIDEIVLGMAHRGRLNVLANILGKSPRQIFREFEDNDPEFQLGGGDVKYHLGYSSDWITTNFRTVHLSLCFNPSHLEFVNPVVLGRLRAKQDRTRDTDREHGLAILIHGDAAFAGEGVVQETLNLSELMGYHVGGAIHVVVNNQIGFTTPPEEGRSSVYATDVAKMLQIPIFHVNGEEPEAVAQVVSLALDFRREFKRDVVIDMYCFRRRGHNEGDEPSFTQPKLYRLIANKPPVREDYLEHLLGLGEVTKEEAEQIAIERRKQLESELSVARSDPKMRREGDIHGIWKGYVGGLEDSVPDVDTGIEPERLKSLLLKQTELPEGFRPHRNIQRLMKVRKEMAEGHRSLDWSTAEAAAFASIATAGFRIRFSGQDSGRGTFSQRHAWLHDNNDGRAYCPLQHLDPEQAPVEIINSPLSENGVLGFEYGYSLDCPDGLILWEAQFGDFANAAQVIIDQFIASAEDKWHRLSGLVLLLPHSFEGMGPEHSSARLERFLQLAARHNIQVVNCTTPAQYFHLLRRQVLRRWRKPLVIMTPKSLLRNPRAVSTLEECAEGRFGRILTDSPEEIDPKDVRSVLLCSGKVYYDLKERREHLERKDVAIIRIEQLYPLNNKELSAALSAYPKEAPALWVQEEPANMGAWRYMRVKLGKSLFGRRFSGVTRPKSSSPATGSASSHRLEQEKLMNEAFAEK